MSHYTGPWAGGGKGGPRRKRVGGRPTWITELGQTSIFTLSRTLALMSLWAMLQLLWCRYRESRCDPLADNAFLVFSACPVITVHERITESASSRGISRSKAKRDYQMDTYTWITRHKTAFRTVFDSEG